jgi:predicted GIY-YIG superfamily endonuclease
VYWIRKTEHKDMFSEGYIGITENMNYRMWRHKRCKTNAHLTNAIKKYGWDLLVKDILLVADTNYCLEIEKKLRPTKNIGWNIAIGGGKPVGWELGEKLPTWVKEKIAKGKKGLKFSDEHKKNLAKAKQGKFGNLANNFKSEIKATNLETGVSFVIRGAKEMENYNFHDSAVYKCINGKQKFHKGHIFERLYP